MCDAVDALEPTRIVIIIIVTIAVTLTKIVITVITMITKLKKMKMKTGRMITRIEYVYTLAHQMSRAYHTYYVVPFVRQARHATNDLYVRQRANTMTCTFTFYLTKKTFTYHLHTHYAHSCCH